MLLSNLNSLTMLYYPLDKCKMRSILKQGKTPPNSIQQQKHESFESIASSALEPDLSSCALTC